MSRMIEFLAIAALVVVIPGPAVVLVLKNALLRGRTDALFTAAGVLAADMVWVAASSAGLTALLVSSQLAFDVVRLIGAVFLIYLGVRLLTTRLSIGPSPETAIAEGPIPVPMQGRTPGIRSAPAGAVRAFREGLLCDLSNPKTAVTFTSIIPQFLDSTAQPADAVRLGVLFAIVGFGSLLMYTALFSAASQVLREAARLRWILRGAGATLVAFGVGLLVNRPAIS